MDAATKDNHFRIWQFSDTHLYADATQSLYGVNCELALQQVLALAKSLQDPADVCLLTGDLVQDGSEDGYLRLLNYFEDLGVRSYCLSGNHDKTDVMRRVLSAQSVNCDDHFLYQQWLVVLLDTTLDGSNAGHLSDSECRRLEALLHQYPDRYVLLAMHHPPLPTKMAWLDNGVTLDNPELVQRWIHAYPNIRGLVWGHAHQAFLDRRDGVLWAGCPSTMAQFRPGVATFELDDVMAGFRYIDLWDDGSIESGVVRIAPSGS
jgi:Icc protein